MYLKRFITVLLLISFISIKDACCSYFADMDETSASFSSSSLPSQDGDLNVIVDSYLQDFREKRGIAVKARDNLIITPLLSNDIDNFFLMWEEHESEGGDYIHSAVKPNTSEDVNLRNQIKIYEKTNIDKRKELKFLRYAIYFIKSEVCKFAGLLTVNEPHYQPTMTKIEEIDKFHYGWSDISIILRPKYQGQGLAYHIINEVYACLFKPLIGQHVICHSYKHEHNSNQNHNEYNINEESTIEVTQSLIAFKGLQALVAFSNKASKRLFNKLGWEEVENDMKVYGDKQPIIFRFPLSYLNSNDLTEGDSECSSHDKDDVQHPNIKKRKISAIGTNANSNFFEDKDCEIKKHKH